MYRDHRHRHNQIIRGKKPEASNMGVAAAAASALLIITLISLLLLHLLYIFFGDI